MDGASLIFRNGQVFTVNARDEVVSAIAVKDGRIVAVGGDADIIPWNGNRTEVIDLKGRALVPGLIDAHCHIASAGTGAWGIDCKYPRVRSIAQIQGFLRESAATTQPGTWVRGRGWNQNKFEEGRLPTRRDLDAAAPDHPVLLTRTCGHILAVNSRVLAMAGITRETPDPVGGQIDRDEHGEPTGILRESACMAVGKLAAFTPEEVARGYRESAWDLIRQGITSAHDAGGSGGHSLNAMIRGAVDGSVPLRVTSMLFSLGDVEPFLDAALTLGLSTGLGNDRFRIGPFKIMVDGSSSGPTCATRQPYTHDPGNSGILYYTQEEVNERFLAAARLGFQVTAHAVGDRAIEMVLGGIEQAMQAAPRPDARHRIEHCAMCMPDLVERMVRLGVVPVAQPVFLYEFGDGYLKNYGPVRGAQMFPAKSFLRRGVPVAASSDHPVTYPDPMLGLSITMSRQTQSGQVVGPEERVTLLEALRMYTLYGAYASHEEHLKGSLEVGKLADLTIVNGPLLHVPPDEIRQMHADMTVIGGEVVHGR